MWPQGCPVAGCKSTTAQFRTPYELKKHLGRGAHKLGDDQIELLLEEINQVEITSA